MDKKNKITLLAVTACFLWSTAFMSVKNVLLFAPPFFAAGIRFMLAGVILVFFCGSFRQYLFDMKSNLRQVLLLGFVQNFLLYSCFYTSMSMISGSVGAIIGGATPLFSATVAHFLMHDDKLTFKKIAGFMVGVFGVAVIVLESCTSELKVNSLLGVFLMLSGNFISAFGNIIVAKTKVQMSAKALNSMQIFFGGMMLMVLSLATEDIGAVNITFSFVAFTFWLSIVSAVAFSIWFYLLKDLKVKVSQINVWKFIMPVFGACFSWMLLPGESPTVLSVLGMVLVAFAIWLVYRNGDAEIKKSI